MSLQLRLFGGGQSTDGKLSAFNDGSHAIDKSKVLASTIGDKLRLKASCQGNFRWWLKEQGFPSADGLRQGSNNQLDLGFSLSFDNA